MLAGFSLKLAYFTMSGKNFQIHGAHIPRKCIESNHSYSRRSPLKTRSNFFSSHLSQKEITRSLRQHVLENLLPSTPERGGGNYDLLYQNLIRKDEDGLEH